MPSPRPPRAERRLAVVIAARNEAPRVGTTVEAARAAVGSGDVVVVADGSTDGTPDVARRAGARVLTAPRGVGKGGALEAVLNRLDADVYLLLDGDLGNSAKGASVLLDAVLGGEADLAIAVLPPEPRHGGFRLVKRFARMAIRALVGFRAQEPLSGQRAMTREVMEVVRPLAPGYSVEVAMTIDAVRAGFRVVEVPVAMEHRPTGRDLAGFVHRGRQGLAVLRAALPRAVGLR